MQLFGIDFTSAPSKSKPITCALGRLLGTRLIIDQIESWHLLDSYEQRLSDPGPWTMAIDIPLGQPRRLVKRLGWPESWEQYVELVSRMTKAEFCEVIKQYRDGQPIGDKHHLRRTDELAGACSPMMLVGVPVGKMFFEGAQRLLRSGVSVLPCRPNGSNQSVIEGYPKLVASYLSAQIDTDYISKGSYKNDKKDNALLRNKREALLNKAMLKDGLCDYGISLEMNSQYGEEIIEDKTGDKLDAIFCLIQAAAWVLKPSLLPPEADPVEGWIVDPTLLID